MSRNPTILHSWLVSLSKANALHDIALQTLCRDREGLLWEDETVDCPEVRSPSGLLAANLSVSALVHVGRPHLGQITRSQQYTSH